MDKLRVLLLVVFFAAAEQVNAQEPSSRPEVDLRLFPENVTKITTIEGKGVQWSCTDHGKGRRDVHWEQENNLPLPVGFKQTRGRVSIPEVALSHQGTYYCLLNDKTYAPGMNKSIFLQVQSKPKICDPNEWPCRSGECITIEKRCDGKFDCGDRSDEVSCQGRNANEVIQEVPEVSSRSEVSPRTYPDHNTPIYDPDRPCDHETNWTSCDASCIQTRVCHIDQFPHIKDDSKEDCVKSHSFRQNRTCPGCRVGGWGEWSAWSDCPPCGPGTRHRERACDNPRPEGGGLVCVGEKLQDEDCPFFPCPVDCRWSEWGEWSGCIGPCDSGIRTRSRTQLQHALNGGRHCEGSNTETQPCRLQLCPYWDSWEPWSRCSTTCGKGFQTRFRRCNIPYNSELPRSAKVYECKGLEREEQYCNERSCRIDGRWSEWDEWSACTATCGGGVRERRRRCDNPPPSYGGELCYGLPSERERCNVEECPVVPCIVNGGWSQWGKWSECSNMTQTKTRWRRCDTPAPANGGRPCDGQAWEMKNCSVCPCSVIVRLSPGRENATLNAPAFFKCFYHSPNRERVDIRMTALPVFEGGDKVLNLHKQVTDTCGEMRRLTITHVTKQTAVTCRVLALNGTLIGSATARIVVDNSSGSQPTARRVGKDLTRSLKKESRNQHFIMNAKNYYEAKERRTVTEIQAKTYGCPNGEFHCLSLLCIPNYEHCNGVNDCGDNSDEIGCRRLPHCNPGFHWCGAAGCVWLSIKCNETS